MTIIFTFFFSLFINGRYEQWWMQADIGRVGNDCEFGMILNRGQIYGTSCNSFSKMTQVKIEAAMIQSNGLLYIDLNRFEVKCIDTYPGQVEIQITCR